MHKNRFIFFATAAFFAFYAMLPFFALYQIPDQHSAARTSAPLGEKVLLCTTEGFRLVDWNDLINGKVKHKPHSQYQCPLCYVAGHGQWSHTPLASGVLPLPLLFATQAANFSSSLHGMLVANHDWQRLRTRSPPLSAVI